MSTTVIQENQLVDVQTAIQLIEEGHILTISGEEALLSQLPKGKWIGGTIPYFYLKGQNGRMDKTKVLISDFTSWVTNVDIQTLDTNTLKNVCTNGYENGFHFLILPAARDIHYSYALNAHNYDNLFTNPLIGLVAGVDLDELSKGRLSKTFNGLLGENYIDQAVVMHCELPPEKVARVEIINAFEPDDNKIIIEVPEDSFTVGDCIINGQPNNLYDYIQENNLDIKYPLVCDYAGATINVSFQQLNEEKREVIFYAPLFKGQKYTTSKAFSNYVEVFNNKVKEVLSNESNVVYNCNCILNYLYGELDKNEIGFSGATAFGEVGYILLNQTFTYLAIDA